MIELSDYYSGGYFLLRTDKPDWEQLKHDLVPEQVISLSQCICPRLCVWWGWTPGSPDAALKFGIPPDKLNEFLNWCGRAHQLEIDHGAMFFSLEIVRRFVQRFELTGDDLRIIGAGLHRECEGTFLSTQSDENGPIGVTERIRQRLPLEAGGKILGYEAVSYSYSDFGHSWLCGGIERDAFELFGIRPNEHGLIATYAEARQVHDWIAEDEMRGGRSEPEPYAPWLLVSYPLETPT